MKRLIIVLMGALSLAAMMLGGCGDSKDKTLAKVGDYEITALEFEDYFSRIRLTYPSAQEEFNKRREILDSLIVTRLLIQAAYEKNIDQMEELSRLLLDNRDKFLLDALYQEHIVEKAEPTDAELKEYYDKLEYKINVSHILLDNPDTANVLLERIKGGENFEKLVYDYSIDPTAQRNKGMLSNVLWGTTVDEFQEAAFQMEPGEVSPPVKSRYGYHIIKFIDRLPNEQRGSFDEMKATIRGQLFNAKAMRLTQEYVDSLKVNYPVTIDTATCRYLMHKREELYPPQLLKTLPQNDFDIEQLDRDERELILATWDNGQMNIDEYLNRLKEVPQNIRPNLDDYDSLATIIFEMNSFDIMVTEALREGLDNSEIYKRKVRLFKELNMADMMKNDTLAAGIEEPDEGQVREYYEEHIDEYTTPAKIHVYEIWLSDEMKARKLAGEINSLQEFKQKAMDMTERPGKRPKAGDLGYIEATWYPTIFEAANNLPVGSIGGPVLSGNKYSIFYVVDRIAPEVKDFLSIKRNAIQKIKNDKKNEMFQRWLDERMKSTSIEVFDDAIWSTIDKEKYPDTEKSDS